MNPAARGDLRSVFDGDACNVMIAANKFQTGFDQPKLVAMYVDKKLAGVDAVQALSRLNRTYPGKEKTFVLDFVNDPETIQEAFQPYYQTTVLDATSEPNLVYDLFDTLRDAHIYQWSEVEAFVEVFFAPGGSQADLLTHCRPAVERYRARFREASARIAEAQRDLKRAEAAGDEVAAVNAQRDSERAKTEVDALELFKKNAGSFLRFYEFMSQIIAYDDADLEKLSVFLRHLLPLLRQAEAGEAVDLSNVHLTHYRLAKRREQDIKLKVNSAAGLVGVTQLGSGTAKDDPEERLSAVIGRLNDIFGTTFSDSDLVNYAETIADKVRENERVMQQVRSNPPEQIMLGDFPGAVQDAVLESSQTHQRMMLRVLEDEPTAEAFARLLLEMMLQAKKSRS